MKPYWLINKEVSFPALKQDIRTDVAIIGAGITGASVCYWLSGKCNVVLLEEDTVASKASGRNAGFLLTGTSDYYNKAIKRHGHDKAKKIWKITQENHDLLEKHVFNKEKCDHRRSGSYLIATSRREMHDIIESVNLLRNDGFDYRLISEGEINEILSSNGFHGAAFNERDGEINPVKLVEAMIKKSKDGIQIFEKTAARRISAGKDGFSIKTDYATIRSDFVVLATSAYTPMLNSYFKGRITPVRGQMLATNPLSKRFEGVFYANYGYEYWRQANDGRVLVGGFRELDFVREKGYKMITTRKIQKNLEKLLAQLSLKFSVEHRWSGIMDLSEDRLPIIGPLPNKKNLLVSAGYSGHGLGFGFYAGRMISEITLHGKTRNMELFSPSRLR
jgi:glycine/D-amino acid oxidase-like deaminating enzyme